MSTAPEPEAAPAPQRPQVKKPAARPAPSPAALIFDDPLNQQSSDDTDHGWGERPTTATDSAADLARFLDEKPPHHL